MILRKAGCQLFLVSSGLQQEPHHLQVTLVAGEGQGGLLKLVAVGVDPGSELEEDSVTRELVTKLIFSSSSHLATVQCPALAASIKGVWPFSLWSSTCAPASSRTLTTSS